MAQEYTNDAIQGLAKQFWEQGYLCIPHFFSQKVMQTCQSEIENHFGDSPTFLHDDNFISRSKTEVIPWFPQREGNSEFDVISNNSLLQALSEAILGEGWDEQYCMVMFSKAGTNGQAWHQDCPPEDPAQFNLNRLVYTMDVTPELGGEVFVRPGTHKQGPLTTGPLFEDFDDQVVLVPKAGTLVLLHGHCWHRIGEVKSGNRVSTNFRAAPKNVPDDITDICVYRNMRYQFSTSEVLESYS